MSAVVGRVVAAGAGVVVGCCSGADRAVLSAVVAAGGASRLRVFAAFGPGGVGSVGPVSAVGAVAAAAAAGASVSWWAGGPSSLAARVRLVRRSRAAVASGGGPAVFFLGGPASAGSLAAAAVAAAAGRPVFAFCCWGGGGSGWVASLPTRQPPCALPGVVGRWVAAQFAGRSCWRWVAPRPSLSLF
ncbi:MAG: hypothetical protein H0U25_06215 [Thermoleophilaceae bacterium]|nr:hypothetical protein [Thermoleophilaceae bacterium]